MLFFEFLRQISKSDKRTYVLIHAENCKSVFVNNRMIYGQLHMVKNVIIKNIHLLMKLSHELPNRR
jgi:hypothetical protein